MDTKKIIRQRQHIEQQLIERAAEDPAFREQLLADPRGAVAEITGTAFPQDAEVKVLEETAGSYYLVLPASASAPAEEELSDSELEAVAGGDFKILWTSLCDADGDGDKEIFGIE